MEAGHATFSGACAPDTSETPPALELLPWLEPLAVSSVDDGRIARITVEAALRRGARPPKQLELRAVRGKLAARYGADRLKLERVGAGPRGRARSTLSFTATFSLPPALVGDPRVVFELICKGRVPVVLPSPLPAPVELQAPSRRRIGWVASAAAASAAMLVTPAALAAVTSLDGGNGDPATTTAATTTATTTTAPATTTPATTSTASTTPVSTEPTATTPVATTPSSTTPTSTTPTSTTPTSTTATTPVTTTPVTTTPVTTTTPDTSTVPGSTTPVATTPVATTPVATTPVSTTPVSTTPAATTTAPAATAPVDPTPAPADPSATTPTTSSATPPPATPAAAVTAAVTVPPAATAPATIPSTTIPVTTTPTGAAHPRHRHPAGDGQAERARAGKARAGASAGTSAIAVSGEVADAPKSEASSGGVSLAPAPPAREPAARSADAKPAATTTDAKPAAPTPTPAPAASKPVVVPLPAQTATPLPSPQTTAWGGGIFSDPFTSTQLGRYAALVGGTTKPPKYLVRMYRATARHYKLPWQVLAAINYVETGYGRDLRVSSAGAEGWMQFMPRTWAEYGRAVTATGKVKRTVGNPWHARDAIFAAAHYLAASGARRNLPRAIYAYNHAGWYVDEVLAIAAEIDSRGLKTSDSGHRKLAAMRTMARLLNGMPYVWGGGHATWMISDGYDCSGFVSAVLHSAGYLSFPVTTQTLPSQRGIKPGPGRWVTIFDRTDQSIEGDHVIVDIDGQWWESGGGAAGAARVHRMRHVDAAYLETFNLVLHPRGL